MSRRPLRGFDPGRLSLARQVAGYSRAELARLTGVSPSTLSQWERGTSAPRVDSLARCARQLGVDVAEFFLTPTGELLLADLRTRRGLLQSDLAAKLGVSGPLVGAIERGELTLSAALAARWAQELDYTVPEVEAAYDRTRTRPPGAMS